jgi:hypothetical protein
MTIQDFESLIAIIISLREELLTLRKANDELRAAMQKQAESKNEA